MYHIYICIHYYIHTHTHVYISTYIHVYVGRYVSLEITIILTYIGSSLCNNFIDVSHFNFLEKGLRWRALELVSIIYMKYG